MRKKQKKLKPLLTMPRPNEFGDVHDWRDEDSTRMRKLMGRTPVAKLKTLNETPPTDLWNATHATTTNPLQPLLPRDSVARKAIPLATGVLDYFPAALIAVAEVSKAGNDQHNPGEAVHWARGKSMDQADTLLRHFLERGALDSDGLRHSAKMAWRALALLQIEMETAGWPVARNAR